MDYLKIKASATAANLGAGFDVFGMALKIPYDIIELETNDTLEIVIKGKNAGDIPIPTEPLKNTAGFVASKLECDVKITIHKGIVPGSGLGSSAAPAAGTVFGLNKMQNHVIESARARLIPGYLDVKNSALRAGASGVAISGSGPAMIAVCTLDKREEVASAMVDVFAKKGIDSEVYITTVGHGVEILE